MSYYLEKPKNADQKQEYWEIGLGLQSTDGLTPSEYVVSLSYENIRENKGYDEVITDLNKYYIWKKSSNRTMEADFASVKIAEILSTDAFSLSPATLLSYHKRIFENIEEFTHPVGKFRDVNISKKEEVLGGGTVIYSDFNEIIPTLTWDFEQQKDKNYSNLTNEDIVYDVTKFISNIWQVHPFREGNTRVVAVFLIKYMRTLGFNLNNNSFKENSKKFRDALVLHNAPMKLQNKLVLEKFMKNTFLKGELSK